MVWLEGVLCVLGAVIVYVLVAGRWYNGYFTRRNIRGPPARVPFVGNMTHAITASKHFKDFFEEQYRAFSNERYFGIIQFFSPVLVIRDVEIIKQICIKDFDHFLDHAGTLSESEDLLFGRSLFTLKGQKWRDMRATLSPAFTSSKMRGMFPFIMDCGEQMTNYFTKEMNAEVNRVRGLIEVDMKDVSTRFTMDVIASCAFGLNVNSFTDRNNQFYMNGGKAMDFSGYNLFKFMFMLVFPNFSKMIRLKFLSKNLEEFFRNLVWDTIKDREDRGIVRQDMINILMEARKGTLKHEGNDDGKEAGFATVEESAVGKAIVKREWEDDDLVGQALSFFVAGSDTSSNLVCFVAHHLALYPEFQKRLYQEVAETSQEYDGKITYEALHKMKYMDMFVSETLRIWPVALMTDRRCIKSYTLPPQSVRDSVNFEVEAGVTIGIPIYSIHHDEQYYMDPEIFDPERFSDENKHNIKPGTYLPFGIGPRNCIGSRFALMEVKIMICSLLLKFEFVTTAKTQNPIKLRKDTFNVLSETGFWVGLKPRHN